MRGRSAEGEGAASLQVAGGHAGALVALGVGGALLVPVALQRAAGLLAGAAGPHALPLRADAGDRPGGQGVHHQALLGAHAGVLHPARVLAAGADAGVLGAAIAVDAALGAGGNNHACDRMQQNSV